MLTLEEKKAIWAGNKTVTIDGSEWSVEAVYRDLSKRPYASIQEIGTGRTSEELIEYEVSRVRIIEGGKTDPVS